MEGACEVRRLHSGRSMLRAGKALALGHCKVFDACFQSLALSCPESKRGAMETVCEKWKRRQRVFRCVVEVQTPTQCAYAPD